MGPRLLAIMWVKSWKPERMVSCDFRNSSSVPCGAKVSSDGCLLVEVGGYNSFSNF